MPTTKPDGDYFPAKQTDHAHEKSVSNSQALTLDSCESVGSVKQVEEPPLPEVVDGLVQVEHQMGDLKINVTKTRLQ